MVELSNFPDSCDQSIIVHSSTQFNIKSNVCSNQIYAYLTRMGHPNQQITCIGHSLGAHICGMVSTHLTKRQHRIIGLCDRTFFVVVSYWLVGENRSFIGCHFLKFVFFAHFVRYTLTGLDPAKPLIENTAPKTFRLTRDDADFVQIIHTNAGTLGQLSFTGALDLCINGGKVQPFCRGNPVRKFWRIRRIYCLTIHASIVYTGIARCSHFLSVCYLANAIFKHKLFPFVPCPKGCVKNGLLAALLLKKKKPPPTSMVRMMHIGQDVPKE